MARPRRFDWLFRPQLAAEDMPLSAETRFAEALADLPAVERSALALSEIGGLNADEIADRLGTDPVIVRKVLARARESVRTTLAVRSRRGLTALIPFQNWWQSGSSAPAVRAAGAVAAAVVGTTVAIGGAAADGPKNVLTSPDPPTARTLAADPVRGATPRIASLAGVDVAPKAAAQARPAPQPAPQRPAPPAQATPPATPPAASPVASPSPPHVVAAEPEHGVPASRPAPGRPPVRARVETVIAKPTAAPVPVPLPAAPTVPVPVPPLTPVPAAVPVPVPAVPLPPVPPVALPEVPVALP